MNADARLENPAVITGSGQAFPAGRSQIEFWDRFYGRHTGEDRWVKKVFLGAGCSYRHAAVDPTIEDISGWSTGDRMARYLDEALPLATAAATDALAEAGLRADDVGLLAVVSCTGYTTPGLDIFLAEKLGANDSLQRLLIGHMGCYAALPGVATVSDFARARGMPGLLVCTEVSSLHLQPASDDMEQVVAHALFSDGAAAVVVEPGSRTPSTRRAQRCGSGLEVLDVVARTDVATADYMRWEITDLGFRMGLSRRVPEVLARHVGPLVEELLLRNDLARSSVVGWAVHPGGPRVLDVVADRLGLSEEAIAPSRRVLDQHGNCSSATVLVVLDEVRNSTPMDPGCHVVALAFGPGLTLYGALLRVV